MIFSSMEFVEAHWSHVQYSCLQAKQSRFEPWPRTFCSLLGQNNAHYASLPLHPAALMGTDKLNARENCSMDYHPILGADEILPVTSCYLQTFPLPDILYLRQNGDSQEPASHSGGRDLTGL